MPPASVAYDAAGQQQFADHMDLRPDCKRITDSTLNAPKMSTRFAIFCPDPRYTVKPVGFLAAHHPAPTIELKIMNRRIFSLTILLASLLFAGLPAFACAECVPTQDCCPTGPLAQCSVDGPTSGLSGFAQQCGTAGAAGSTVFAADESSNDFNKHLKRCDVPILPMTPAITPTFQVASIRLSAHSATSSFTPTYTLLYLSTGRLRL
jgi:hypothetical protein